MLTEVVENTTNSDISFNKSFYGHKNALGKILSDVSCEFWENNFEYKLLSISQEANIMTQNADYFVTQIKLYEDIGSSIKLSQNTIDIFLETALGDNGYDFEIEHLTELEAKILTAFNRSLYKAITKLFIPEINIKNLIKEDELKKDLTYFTFLASSQGKPFGKIIIILPSQIIQPPEEVTPAEKLLPESLFEKSPIYTDIFVGETRTTLEDVKLLESGDIIILDKSDISKMRVKGKFDFEFNINPDPMLVYNYQENEDYESDEDNMTETLNNNDKNRWDLIHVDMSAEFEKIKMPLGELRQISKGLIVDLAPVYQNKITLKVEDNAIATGELVIIDDKYGVLLDEVFSEEEAKQSTDSPDEAPAAEVTKDEDFDIEDFDIEDEDLDDELGDDMNEDFDDEDI